MLWEMTSGIIRVFSAVGSTADTRSRVSLRSFLLNFTHVLREDRLSHAGRKLDHGLLAVGHATVDTWHVLFVKMHCVPSHGGDGFKDAPRNIDAVISSFPLYSSGVLTASRGANVDHAVLAVAGSVYWKVKNPSELSGMGGHAWLFRGKALPTSSRS